MFYLEDDSPGRPSHRQVSFNFISGKEKRAVTLCSHAVASFVAVAQLFEQCCTLKTFLLLQEMLNQ